VPGDDWKEIAERGYGSWTRRDLDGLLAVMAPDVAFYSAGLFPGVEDEYHGHAGMTRFWAHMQEPWESFVMEPVRIEPHGDAAVIDLRFRAVGKGSGVKVDMTVFHAVRKSGGRVVELRSHATRGAACADLKRKSDPD
jgi:ketosteroid isomerase-like protein